MRKTSLFLALITTGCYSFTGGRVPFKTVAVPAAVNATSEFRLSEMVTKALMETVARDGRMKLAEPRSAQGSFEVEVTGYQRQPYVYDRQEAVSQYRVTVTAKAALRSATGRTVWEETAISGWATYATDSLDETAGMAKAAAALAEEIVRRSLEVW